MKHIKLSGLIFGLAVLGAGSALAKDAVSWTWASSEEVIVQLAGDTPKAATADEPRDQQAGELGW